MSFIEAKLGEQMAALAKSEGHRRGFPSSVKPSFDNPELVARVRDMTEQGLRPYQICAACGIPEPKLAGNRSRNGIKQ